MKVILCTSLLLVAAFYHPTVLATSVEKCPDHFDPDHLVFLPHADCSKFYICSQSGPSEKNCPPGLHWNPIADVCDWPALAGCDPQSATSTTTTVDASTTLAPTTDSATVTTEAPSTADPSTTTTTFAPSTTTEVAAPSSTVPPTGKCPNVFDPHHVVFLPHRDCSKFYVCTADGPIETSCPAGLHWSQQESICDWPETAGCVAGTVQSSSAIKPNRESVSECPELYDPDNEVFLAHTSDCGRYYLCTWGGIAVLQSCPAGLHWNKHTDQCDWPAQAGCKVERDPHFRHTASQSVN